MKSELPTVLVVFFSILANAASAQELSESLTRCRAVTEDAARLHCYDAVVHALQGAEGQVIATAPDEQSDELIDGTITAIEFMPSGGRIVTLDNGQRWRETGTAPSLKLYVGQTVRIKPGVFDSFRLFGQGNRATRVRRLD